MCSTPRERIRAIGANSNLFLQDVIANLKVKEKQVNEIGAKVEKLPRDEETTAMSNQVTVLRERIVWLIEQSVLGREQVGAAMGKQAEQKSNLKNFEGRIVKWEDWMKNVRASVAQQKADQVNPDEIDSVVETNKVGDNVKTGEITSSGENPILRSLKHFWNSQRYFGH